MTCQEFETIVTDLATNRMDCDETHAVAARHAKSCAGCARRLANEHALSAALLSVAAGSRSVQAPDRVETALLAAFRNRDVAPVAGVGSDGGPVPATRAHQPWFGWVLAAAATLAITFGVSAWRVSTDFQNDGVRHGNDQAMNEPAQQIPDRMPANILTIDDAEGRGENRPSAGTAAAGTGRTARVREANRSRAYAQRPLAAPVSPVSDGTDEITTDFFPLVASSGMLRVDGGRVVRVEVPRSQVAALGLPVNFERSDERITADVVLGNDGIARAIRFVQPRLGER